MPATVLEELGEQLRQAREARGLSIEDAERATRIRARYLYALEDAELDVLPTPVQLRGFLRNYSQFLGLDPGQSIRLLDATLDSPRKSFWRSLFRPSPPASESQTISADYTTPDTNPPSPTLAQGHLSASRRLGRFLTLEVLIVFIMLVGVIGVFAWGGSKISESIFSQREITITPEVLGPTATPTLLGRITFTPTKPPPLVSFSDVQLSLVVEQRSFVRVTVDGVLDFEGILTPDERLNYSGAQLLEVTTANGAGIRVVFNQRDEGFMGGFGEVVTWIFTPNSKSTATLAADTPTP